MGRPRNESASWTEPDQIWSSASFHDSKQSLELAWHFWSQITWIPKDGIIFKWLSFAVLNCVPSELQPLWRQGQLHTYSPELSTALEPTGDSINIVEWWTFQRNLNVGRATSSVLKEFPESIYFHKYLCTY